MATVNFGNHSLVVARRRDRQSVREFYCDVLGGKLLRADTERDFIRLGDNFYIGFLYSDVPDGNDIMRCFRSIWLELKTDDVEEMKRKILASGVKMLDLPDRHLFFQAPGGQCLRLVGVDEDLSFYEGADERPKDRALHSRRRDPRTVVGT